MAKEVKEKKKSCKGLVIFSIILVLIIVASALFLYIAIDEGFITINKDEDVVDIIKKDNNNKIKEKNITDSNLIVDLKNKVAYLNANKIYQNHIIPNLYKEEKITYIGEEEKLNIVLESLSNSYTSITIPKEEIEKSVGSYYINNVLEDNKQITIDKVKTRYKELFSSNIDKFHHIEGCPTYLYDSINNVYYITTKCTKGTSINKEYTYDIKYTKEDNFAYVYVSVGTAYINNNISSNETKLNIYKGYSNAIYKEEVSLKEAEEFNINKDNYNDFSIYKYKFFKDDTNNYYFVSVEKVK